MFKAFKEFAFKGNIVDMAVGFILGAGFSTVVKSLVSNVVMPVIGLLMGGIKFEDLKIVLQAAGADPEANPEVAITYGKFIDDFLAFSLLAFVVFLIVKKFIAAFEKKEEEAEPETPRQEVLLEEIRDALKK